MTSSLDAEMAHRVEVRLTPEEQRTLETADIVFAVYPDDEPDMDVSLLVKGVELCKRVTQNRNLIVEGSVVIGVIGVKSIDAAHVLRSAVDQGLVPSRRDAIGSEGVIVRCTCGKDDKIDPACDPIKGLRDICNEALSDAFGEDFCPLISDHMGPKHADLTFMVGDKVFTLSVDEDDAEEVA